MAHHSAGHGASLGNDKELGHVDYAGTESGLGKAQVSRGSICLVWVLMMRATSRMHNIGQLTIMIRTHLLKGTSVHTGKVSTKGMAYRSRKAARGAWLNSNCMLFIFSFL